MITRNGYTVMGAGPADYDATLIDTSGTTRSVSSGYVDSIWLSTTIQAGTGTTIASMMDYKLENQVSLSYAGASRYVTSNATLNMPFLLCCSTIAVNTTNEPITLTEIGLIGSYGGYSYLLSRKLITPITLQPGQSTSLSITIK